MHEPFLGFMYVQDTHAFGSQNEVWDSLELELQVLWATVQILESKHGLPARATSSLNHCDTAQTLFCGIFPHMCSFPLMLSQKVVKLLIMNLLFSKVRIWPNPKCDPRIQSTLEIAVSVNATHLSLRWWTLLQSAELCNDQLFLLCRGKWRCFTHVDDDAL